MSAAAADSSVISGQATSTPDRGDTATNPSKIKVFCVRSSSFLLRNERVCDTLAGGSRNRGGEDASAPSRFSTRCGSQAGRLRFQASKSARTKRYGEGGHS